VIVTGSGRGIGRATAAAFSELGYRIVVAEILPGLGRQTAKQLRGDGVEAVFLQTDVADVSSVRRMVRTALKRMGRIDCLVNNAGVLRTGRLVDLPWKTLDWMLDVNLRGLIVLTRAVLPTMLRQGSGAIINVASQLGKYGLADYVTYCASKFGVVGFTEALAAELTGAGVRVWAVCPGLVDTPMAREAGISRRERAGLIQPERVARTIVDLATGKRREASGAAVNVV
jgi:NAD(P)-dependent dehydrogenase (short-subunit alcohol dehydrogenase family)